MSFYGIIVIAVGLAMVNFSMSFLGSFFRCQDVPGTLKISSVQTFFQAALFTLGWVLSISFRGMLATMNWPLSIILLLVLGTKMLVLSRKAKPPDKAFDLSHFRVLIGVSFASGINAFITGLTLGLIDTNLWPAVISIAIASFAFSILGVIMGKISGNVKYSQVAEAFGGLLIIFTGIMLFMEFLHLI